MKDENGNDLVKWKRMSKLRESIIQRTGFKWDRVVNGKMMLGYKLSKERLPK